MPQERDNRRDIVVAYGTRPEAVKMAPVVHALRASTELRPTVVVSGQHREMLDQINALFEIQPDADLNILNAGQTLEQITVRALSGFTEFLRTRRPAAVLVQGDTTTTFAAALAGFYSDVPVVHVEAGLRTGNARSPYPEEINRRLTTQLASLHLAPTQLNRANLVAEGVDPSSIRVTGNTVIDAFLAVSARQVPSDIPELEQAIDSGRRLVLVTAHRRESWGEPMQAIGRAVRRLAESFPDTIFVLPLHKNPLVREALLPSIGDSKNVIVTEPLGYAPFCRVIAASTLVLTDSGGVQEEAPSAGKPVLVLRDTTERPEAVHAGTVRLVGTREDVIVDAASVLLRDADAYAAMARAVNPYGDGLAARRTVAAVEHMLGAGEPAEDFAGGI